MATKWSLTFDLAGVDGFESFPFCFDFCLFFAEESRAGWKYASITLNLILQHKGCSQKVHKWLPTT